MRTQLVIALATFAAFMAPTRPSYRRHPAGSFVASGKIKTAGKMPALLNPNHAATQSASASQSTAQSPAAADDEAAIRHVAELYMSFEPAKLREGFYTQSNLYVAGPQGELRVIPFRAIS